ncbi:CDP-diacylglycerol--glycerol-3-phosphate 3-phosphatidyltransferase [bacterium]|jgi:CDP-diacylglycerol---glycerol-3-phosphate 3-phosphatidyltransferase|nr:CDP-diacylglycerol--glycerol-3-phosphate 3-phosphatidyltransferase [bacterium]
MNLALKLTFLRILLAPVFAWALLQSPGNLSFLWLSLVLAVILEATDYFDGFVARKFNMTSEAGKILDPMADSIARLTCFLAFFQLNHASIWMVLVFVYRDSLVSGLRILAASQSKILGARGSGKFKAVVQALAIVGIPLVLLVQQYGINIYMDPSTIIFILMLIAVIGTLYSLWDYLYANRSIISQLV